jgi:hypothetical protein
LLLIIKKLSFGYEALTETSNNKITILSVTMRETGLGQTMYVKVRNDSETTKSFVVEMILEDKDGIPYNKGTEGVDDLAPGETAITDRYFDKISGAIGSARIKKVY